MNIKSDEILEKIEQDQHSFDIVNKLNVYHKSILNHLQKTGYKRNSMLEFIRKFSVKNKLNRLYICDMLLNRNEIDAISEANHNWRWKVGKLRDYSSEKIMETTSKSWLAANRVMLCIWWD